MERPQPGDTIGRWTVERWVASGAHGEVFRVFRTQLPDLHGALKWRREGVAPAPLTDEADVLEKLDHDGIARLLDRGPGDAWLVLGWAQGQPLDTLGRLAPGAAALVLSRLAAAVAHVHARGYAHGDLKPANVRVDAGGRTTLLDFGSVRAARSSGSWPSTPRYAPPEWFGTSGIDPTRSDVYALGVLLFELCSGQTAFGADSPEGLAQAKRAGPLSGPSLPAPLAELVEACTAPDPAGRPTASQVHRRLHALADAAVVLPSTATLAATASTAQPLPDRRYQVLEELGRGGMGVVHRVWDAHLERYVALKRPLAHVDEQRFLREARLMADLEHPHLVRTLDVARDAVGPYFTMELIEGEDLGCRVRRGPLPARQAATWIAEIAEALVDAHARRRVHRDIKPSNILIDQGGRARLVDFGLARDLTMEGATLSGSAVMGTPAYMSLDQLRGDEPAPAMDVHALGAVLFECLTGEPPHGHGTVVQMLLAMQRDHPPSVRQLRPSLEHPLAAICATALAREAASRPTAAELAADLRRYLAGEPVHAAAPSRLVRWASNVRRHPARLAATVLGTALLSMGLVWGVASLAERAATQRQVNEAGTRWATVEEELEDWEAQGRHGEVDEGIDAFVSDERTAAMPARVDALLWHQRALSARYEHERALDRAVDAWLQGEDADQERTLEALFVTLQAVGRLDAASRLTAAVGLSPSRAVALRQAEHFSAGRFEQAAALEGPLQSLAAALTPATRTEAPAPLWFRAADVLEGGSQELLGKVVDDGPAYEVLLSATPTLPELQRLEGHPQQWLHPVQGGILAGRGTEGGLRRYQDGEWVTAEAVATPAYRVRQDPDGQVWMVGGDKVLRWRPGEVVEDLWPAAFRTQGEIESLAVGDLDGDGVRELAVAPGQWGGFELWVLTEDDDGGYVPLTHEALGYLPELQYIEHMGPDALLGVVASSQYGSRRIFPEGSPYGMPRGVHLLRLRDGALETAHHQPMTGSCSMSYLGDLDGDGIEELVSLCDDQLALITADADGVFHHVRVAGLKPLGVFDLDEDGEDELIVRGPEGVVWTLGAGTGRLTLSGDVPEVPALPERWRRAERLARVGLWERAAQWLLGASIGDGERARAVELATRWLVRAKRPLLAQDALGREPAATRAAGQLLLDEAEGRSGEVATTWVFDRQVLPTPLHVHQPGMVHSTVDGLLLDALDGVEPLLSVPLTASPHVWVRASLTLDELYWMGNLYWRLVDEAGEVCVEHRLEAWGGGMVVQLKPIVQAPEVRLDEGAKQTYDNQPLDLVATLTHDGTQWRVMVDYDGVRTEQRVEGPVPTGPLRFELGGGDMHNGPRLARARVHALTFEGALPVGAAPVDAARLLATGRAEEALALPEADLRTRLVALEELGRRDEALVVLDQVPRQQLLGWVADLDRTGRYRWHEAFRERLGPRWPVLWQHVHYLEVFSYGPSPRSDALMLESLGSLAEVPLERVAGVNWLGLRLALSQARRRAGRFASAREDLKRLLAMEETERMRGDLWMEMARLEASAGDLDAAVHAAGRALALSQLPPRTRRLLVDGVAGLPIASEPAWLAVVQPEESP